MLKDKKAKLKSGIVQGAILAIVIIVVLFEAYAVLIPEAQSAGEGMNDTNRCAAAGCFYNASRSVDCTAVNTSTLDTVLCTNPGYTIPLSGLVDGTGVVFVIIMAALMVLIVMAYFRKGGK